MSSLASERKEKYKQLCLAGPGLCGHSPQGDQGRPMLAFGSVTVTPWSPPSTAIGGWGWPRNARATRGVAEPASLPAKSASPPSSAQRGLPRGPDSP